MFIYLITNTLSGKYYIGQTRRSVHTRWIQHKSASVRRKSRSYIHSAIKKYGSENFKIETLCQCFSDQELDHAEKFLVWFMAANKSSFGYNLKEGGDSRARHSEATKSKISLVQKGRILTPEHRRKISQGSVGIKKTREHAANISNGKKNKIYNQRGYANPHYRKDINTEELVIAYLDLKTFAAVGIKFNINPVLARNRIIARASRQKKDRPEGQSVIPVGELSCHFIKSSG